MTKERTLVSRLTQILGVETRTVWRVLISKLELVDLVSVLAERKVLGAHEELILRELLSRRGMKVSQ